MAKIRVYYNSACPVCDAGVARQRRRMESAGLAGDVEWRDMIRDPGALADRGVTLDDVRLKLHVVGKDGRLHVGAGAFAALWAGTPGQRWLAGLMRWPGIAALARWGYDLFAARLYRWNRRHGRW